MADAVKEILGFLAESNDRLDVKIVTLKQILGLTATKEGLEILKSSLQDLLRHLVIFLAGKSETLAKDSSLALVNLTADPKLANQCLREGPEDLIRILWDQVEDEQSAIADPCCMILCNLSNSRNNCDLVMERFKQIRVSLDRVLGIFCILDHNQKKAKLHYLAPLVSNLSQLPEARLQLLDRRNPTIARLLTFTEYQESNIRRGGIIGTLKNCCFDPNHHEWLLDESGANILPKLLLPLAGPSPDDLDDEEMNKLPVDLQYLDEDKKTEPDPDIRKMLLEALLQLCSTRRGREIIRNRNAYYILRDLHKTEEDKAVKLACENVVDVLIKKEEEIGFDSYHGVEIPPDVEPELKQMDEDYLAD